VHDAPAWLTRLTDWLEVFEPAFSHRAQRGGLRRYVEGVLSDSRVSAASTINRIARSG
jgi:hypothetical protein